MSEPHHDPYTPVLLKGVRAERFQVTFVMRSSEEGWLSFVFDAQDKDSFSEVVLALLNEDGEAGVFAARRIVDGKAPVAVTGSGGWTSGGTNQPLWVRITSNDTTLTVHGKISTTEPTSWDQLYQTSGFGLKGGMIGFRADMFSGASTIDDLVVRRWNAGTSAFDIIDHIDRFTVDGSGYAAEDLEHDAAGNLTYDGVFAYTYDAWNRLVAVARAYRDGGSVQAGGVINQIRYDGRGRRIVKGVRNSADLDATYHYYYDGDSVVEVHNGSNELIKHYVWGIQYIDELVQVLIREMELEPSKWDEGYFFWALQDANYNVLGVVDHQGVLAERYEYTPYGERTVFISAGADDPGLYAPTYASSRIAYYDGVPQPWGLCDIGHQGLMLDEETGNYDNRARIYIPRFARFGQQDPLGYVDGMNLYAYVRLNPINRLDPSGNFSICPDLCDKEGDLQNAQWHVQLRPFAKGLPPGAQINAQSAIWHAQFWGGISSAANLGLGAARGMVTFKNVAVGEMFHEARNYGFVDAMLEEMATWDNRLMNLEGAAIWVYVAWQRCESERCLLVCQRLNWIDKDGWHRCSQGGSHPAGGFRIEDRRRITNAIPRCVVEAMQALIQ